MMKARAGIALMLVISLAGAAAADGHPGVAHKLFQWRPFLAPFHAVVLHFPIGFLTVAGILEIYRVFRPSAELRRVTVLVLGLGLIGAVAVGAGVVLLTPEAGRGPVPKIVTVPQIVTGPQILTGPGMRGDGTAPVVRVAMVRGGGAVLYRDPDRTSPVVARLAAGSRVWVQGMPWRNLMPWAQVEVDGRPGYVAMTEGEVF